MKRARREIYESDSFAYKSPSIVEKEDNNMSHMKRLLEDIISDYASNVYSISELAEKYDVSERIILDAIDLYYDQMIEDFS